MPADKQFLFWREFITAQLHGHLKAVGVKVVEVLHAWPEKKKRNRFTQKSMRNCADLSPTPLRS